MNHSFGKNLKRNSVECIKIVFIDELMLIDAFKRAVIQ